jgi:hypothetical protein
MSLKLFCPVCGSTNLQENSTNDKAFCNKCQGTFELTPVNAWYKGTGLENVEYDKGNA